MDNDYQAMKDLDYEQTIEELEYKNESYLNDLQKLSDTNDELQSEIAELNDAIDDLVLQQREAEDELLYARRSFTGFQVAVSMLVFIYGMLYGSYVCPK